MEGVRIVTTATADKRNSTILTDNMVSEGLHMNAAGGDCPGKTQLHRDILMRSGIIVECTPQTRIEGETRQLPADHACCGRRAEPAAPGEATQSSATKPVERTISP